jgi:hypothetical protein
MPSLVDDILACTDEILGIRDDIGAIKHTVHILTRTWDGSEVGDGNPVDATAQILPTPYLIDLFANIRLREGGKIEEGDLMVKHISKQSYPDFDVVSLKVTDDVTEKYYYINEKLYEVIHVKEDYVYWNIHIRQTAKQDTYIA